MIVHIKEGTIVGGRGSLPKAMLKCHVGADMKLETGKFNRLKEFKHTECKEYTSPHKVQTSIESLYR